MRRLALVLALSACAPPELADVTPGGSRLEDARLVPYSRVDRVDVLFVLDDTISMVEKASLVDEAVPAMVGRLAETWWTRDVHVGFITSSLGSFGGDTCAANPANSVGEKNDRAHLVGYLEWAPGVTREEAVSKAANELAGIAYDGCGMEAPLEAWYRFLVDPAPPAEIVVEDGLAKAVGVDEVLLTQRREFLRPDSLLLIVMLSDENDCSVDFHGQGWMVGRASTPLPSGTSACEHDPLGPCCRSCTPGQPAIPGCLAIEDDSACKTDPAFFDHLNLRCFDQKRRFGVDFLYPTRRYVEALTKPQLTDTNGALFTNPLFESTHDGYPVWRDLSLIHLVTIGGVPWQDIATEESLSDPSVIQYLTGYELWNQNRFDWLTPKCLERGAGGICDTWDPKDKTNDPLLFESIWPRDGQNPATNTPLVATFGDYLEQPINGHEHAVFNSLQYSCIYPLPEPRDCTGSGCPCSNAPAVPGVWSDSDPVCQTTRGYYSREQRFASAFPPTRQLEVIRDLSELGTVASICPKLTDVPPSDRRFAYNPALDSVTDRLTETTMRTTSCLGDSYDFEAKGISGCHALVNASQLDVCGCGAPGFAPVSTSIEAAARKKLGLHGLCSTSSQPCDSICICELEPTAGAAADACESDQNDFGTVPGFCGLAAGEPANACPSGQNALKFVGLHTSFTLLIYCD